MVLGRMCIVRISGFEFGFFHFFQICCRTFSRFAVGGLSRLWGSYFIILILKISSNNKEFPFGRSKYSQNMALVEAAVGYFVARFIGSYIEDYCCGRFSVSTAQELRVDGLISASEPYSV